MAKRFTDNEKWKKKYFKGLSTVNKLFFLYVLDECDHAGVWNVEADIASLRIGEEIDLASAIQELGKHIHIYDNGEKWFVPSFIEFQYGTLNPNVNTHKSVLNKLEQRKLTKIYQQFINCSTTVPSGVKDKDMDKAKDKDMDKAKDMWNFLAENYGLSTVKVLTQARRDKLKARFKEKEFDLIKILKEVEVSDFLLGKQKDATWKVDFDFIIRNDTNYIKILEGKYNGNSITRETKQRLSEAESNYFKD